MVIDDVVAMVTVIHKADADDGVQGADVYVRPRQRGRRRRLGSLLVDCLCRRHRRREGKYIHLYLLFVVWLKQQKKRCRRRGFLLPLSLSLSLSL